MGRSLRFIFILVAVTAAGCNLTDKGLAQLQVVEEMFLGAPLDEIKSHWFLYSTKPLQVDQIISSDQRIVYRGVSRDPGVTGFYLFFDAKTRTLERAEWRYHSSMTNAKEKELLEEWTKRLGDPSYHRRWEGRVYSWADRNARLELYLSEGLCHLIHRLN